MQIAKKTPSNSSNSRHTPSVIGGPLRLRQDIVRAHPTHPPSYPLSHKQASIMSHEERFIPERQKLDQLGVVKDYAVHPRLDYR